MLIKAEDHEDAIGWVQAKVTESEDNFPKWSDWHEVAAGRFSLEGFAFDEFGLELQHNYVVSYETEQEQFEIVLSKLLDYKVNEFAQIKEKLVEAKFSIESIELFSYKSFWESENWLQVYDLQKLTQLAGDDYIPESYVYDLENHTPSLKYFYESIQNGDKNWFGVMVDFHF